MWCKWVAPKERRDGKTGAVWCPVRVGAVSVVPEGWCVRRDEEARRRRQ